MVLLGYSVNEVKYEVYKTEARYSCSWSGYVDQPTVSKHRVGCVYFIFDGIYARMDGIGRHEGLKNLCRKVCGFEPHF